MQILKYILTLTLALPIIAFSQDNDTSFYKVYSSSGFDMGEGICQLPDSSYLVTGTTGGAGSPSAQAFVMKLDKLGKQMWTVTKGGDEDETGRRVFFVNDTIYVFGRTNSFGNSYDYYFLKLDSAGNFLAEKHFGTADYEWLQDAVFQPSDSTFILYGFWQENNGFGRKRQLLKVDRNGNEIWKQEIPIAMEAKLGNMHIFEDSLIGVTGSEFLSDSAHYAAAFYVFRNDGTLKDSVIYSESSNRDFIFTDFARTDYSIFLTGYYEEMVNDTLQRNLRIIRYDRTLDTLIVDMGDSPNGNNMTFQYLLQKTMSPTDFFVIERATSANFSTYPDNHWDENYEVFTGTYDIYWTGGVTNVSRPGDDITNQFITTADGGAIAVGYKEEYGNFTQSVFVLKIGPNNEAVEPYAVPEEESLLKINSLPQIDAVEVFPNPTTSELHIGLKQVENVQVMTIEGKIILTKNGENTINVSNLPRGIYLLKATSNGFLYQCKFIKE